MNYNEKLENIFEGRFNDQFPNQGPNRLYTQRTNPKIDNPKHPDYLHNLQKTLDNTEDDHEALTAETKILEFQLKELQQRFKNSKDLEERYKLNDEALKLQDEIKGNKQELLKY